jgi:hypothetical protein
VIDATAPQMQKQCHINHSIINDYQKKIKNSPKPNTINPKEVGPPGVWGFSKKKKC